MATLTIQGVNEAIVNRQSDLQELMDSLRSVEQQRYRAQDELRALDRDRQLILDRIEAGKELEEEFRLEIDQLVRRLAEDLIFELTQGIVVVEL